MAHVSDITLSGGYVPVARYIRAGDFVEYCRVDRPCLYRRVDEFLTLVLDVKNREAIGFRLKGFRSFFLHNLEPRKRLLDEEFLALVSIIEIAATRTGEEAFSSEWARDAYKKAYQIAHCDRVSLSEAHLAA